MFSPALRDLVKPQWLSVLSLLKKSGGLSIPSICQETDSSYMTVKAHCEELAKRGYLVRTRLPREKSGRPEIEYSLSSRASDLFSAGEPSLSMGLLAEAKALYGDIAPERIIHQWIHRLADQWRPSLEKCQTLDDRVTLIAELRNQQGWLTTVSTNPIRLTDHHHPLHHILKAYPKVKVTERRLLEDLTGCRIQRQESSTGRESPPVIIYTFE